MPNEESVKLGKTREGNNGVGTERNDAFVFISLGEFVGEPRPDDVARAVEGSPFTISHQSTAATNGTEM